MKFKNKLYKYVFYTVGFSAIFIAGIAISQFWLSIVQEETIYPVGFEIENFKKLSKGDSVLKVIDNIGVPLNIGKHGYDEKIDSSNLTVKEFINLLKGKKGEHKYVWTYSRQGDTKKDWELLYVSFNDDKKVINVNQIYVTD